MTLEDQHTDLKSLRTITGKTADWDGLAKDCVCFGNGAGGRLLIGIEDGETLPPPVQVVPPELLDKLRKRIGELTVNVQALPSLQRAANGGEYIELTIDHLAWHRHAMAAISCGCGIAVNRYWATMCCVWPTSALAALGKRWTAGRLEISTLPANSRTSSKASALPIA